jgi:mannitol-1-phosphate 5-dehydrogenase
MKHGVQFGAGNIGRGFIGHLLWESGFRTIFVEANRELVQLLNERGCYPLRLLDKDGTAHNLVIDGVEALSSSDEEKIAQAVATAEVVFTAVGVKNLRLIARALAQGIAQRAAENPQFLNVFLCENLKDAPLLLQEEVAAYLSHEAKNFCREKVGFVGTVVARMVPVMGERYGVRDPLFIVAESYHQLPFDVQAVKGKAPSISGLKPAGNFQAEIEKKLFLHNLGHAVLAYVGYLKKCAYIHEAIKDRDAREVLDGVWQEVSQALFRKYPLLDRAETEGMIQDLRERFANPALMDTVERVGREPLRKLQPEDRLVGGIRFCLSEGIFPRYIIMACAAALYCDFPHDSEAVALQKMIAEKGVANVLREICALDPESEVGKELLLYYEFWERKRRREN